MRETQIHNIEVLQESLPQADTGGGYRRVNASIVVDSSRHIREQKIALIHETLGLYFGVVTDPETLTEIAEHIVDCLEELKV